MLSRCFISSACLIIPRDSSLPSGGKNAHVMQGDPLPVILKTVILILQTYLHVNNRQEKNDTKRKLLDAVSLYR